VYFGYSTVPNLIGMTGYQVSDALDVADFRSTEFERNYADMSSKAVSQSPAAGTRWSKTSTVHVTLDPATAQPGATRPTQAAAPTTTYVAPSTTYSYVVEGKNRAIITYANKGGNTSQETSAKLPWRVEVDSPSFGGMTFAYVSAQNSGSGTITCRIIGPGGSVISENSSNGAYAIVTCQA
jgi:beta-lactam-binding protein with PASTA domain